MSLITLLFPKSGKDPQVGKPVQTVENPDLLIAVKSTVKTRINRDNLYEAGIVKIEADLGEVEIMVDDEPQITDAVTVTIHCQKPQVLKRNIVIHPLRQDLFMAVLNVLGTKKFIKLDIKFSSPYE